MQVRSFEELVRAMRSVAGRDQEALAHVKHLEVHAVVGTWNRSKPLPRREETVGFDDPEVCGERFPLMMVHAGVKGERYDPMFWSIEAVNHATEESCYMAFVDGRPCHADWLAFKALSEYAELRGLMTLRELAIGLALTHSQEMIMTLIEPTVAHLRARRRAMLLRLLDGRLKGRIDKKANALKFVRKNEAPRVAHRLAQDVFDLLAMAWPDAAGEDEQHVRTEIVQIATMGAVEAKLSPVTSPTLC